MSAKPITNMRARSMKRTAAACSTHYKTNWLWHDFGTCCFVYRVFVPKTLQIQRLLWAATSALLESNRDVAVLALKVFRHLLFSLWLKKKHEKPQRHVSTSPQCIVSQAAKREAFSMKHLQPLPNSSVAFPVHVRAPEAWCAAVSFEGTGIKWEVASKRASCE